VQLLQHQRRRLHRGGLSDSAPSGYEGRIGRYTPSLAKALVDVAEVKAGERVLDVGCGSGPLAADLVSRVGPDNVFAIDPDENGVAAFRQRLPDVDVRVGYAEDLPYPDDSFDVTLAQLVLTLLSDADQAVTEMRRVTRPGGRVGTCVWDFGGGMRVLRTFWDAAGAVSPELAHEYDQARTRPYATAAELEALWRSAGMHDISTGELVAGADYRDFEDLWQPLATPDGPPGKFLEQLDEIGRAAVKSKARERLGSPSGSFRLEARAWYVLGSA
jgi:ubiquinone/menaquinone biosynthesis C-methylase UbiE